jgi:hypothetical protein
VTGLILPNRSGRPKGRNWVNCAAEGCSAWGKARPDWAEGAVFPKPPEGGWSFIDGWDVNSDGRVVELRLFVCSPSCQRRLAMRLITTTKGRLD